MRQFLIELTRQQRRNFVVNLLGGSDHYVDICRQQAVHLRLGRAGVQKDELQVGLFGQEVGKTTAVDVLQIACFALEEQFIAVGVATVVKDGDAPA